MNYNNNILSILFFTITIKVSFYFLKYNNLVKQKNEKINKIEDSLLMTNKENLKYFLINNTKIKKKELLDKFIFNSIINKSDIFSKIELFIDETVINSKNIIKIDKFIDDLFSFIQEYICNNYQFKNEEINKKYYVKIYNDLILTKKIYPDITHINQSIDLIENYINN